MRKTLHLHSGRYCGNRNLRDKWRLQIGAWRIYVPNTPPHFVGFYFVRRLYMDEDWCQFCYDCYRECSDWNSCDPEHRVFLTNNWTLQHKQLRWDPSRKLYLGRCSRHKSTPINKSVSPYDGPNRWIRIDGGLCRWRDVTQNGIDTGNRTIAQSFRHHEPDARS